MIALYMWLPSNLKLFFLLMDGEAGCVTRALYNRIDAWKYSAREGLCRVHEVGWLYWHEEG